RRRVVPLTPPSAFGASSFENGEIVSRLADGALPREASASDPAGFASAAFAWELEIPAGGARDVLVAVPLGAASLAMPLDAARDFESRQSAAARSWREKLDRVTFRLPAAAEPIAGAARASLGWILVNRDGPAIQPGSRAYARSWIRDGALTSAALLRLGHADEVREFLRWFAPFQFESGAVPCCVDRRGADPVPENDSHGELLFLAAEYFRFTGDRATLEEVWPYLAKAAAYIERLRQSRRTEEYRSGEKLLFFGLLPESISHEGYSDHPVHSYWDDFWAVQGLSDAADLARALNRGEEAVRLTASRDELRHDVHASIRRVIAARGIDFIPGSADLGDLDPTSTTISIEPCGEAGRLPRRELSNTFDRYWERFIARRAHRATEGEYTPYEWRVAGSFVRLNRRDRAQALFDFFFSDRRPAAWNHWAEVVWPDPRSPKFIGDMPHGWVGSDFIRSFLDLFAYDREEDGTLVLGAGVPASWLADPRGVAVSKLQTRYGPLDLTLRADRSAVRVRIAGACVVPPGGFVVPWPLEGRPSSATVNGKAAGISPDGEVLLRETPADVVIVK
ncbi:MAG TPA: coagulation factor 5/8 type domain-containing protein, partial [Thermoanaerobaculia bacterium]|nr:coagulation factor 5/8 type domain-containing protein [Thermoanaerobaculia bacterium]